MKQTSYILLTILLLSNLMTSAQWVEIEKLPQNKFIEIDGNLNEKNWDKALISDKLYAKNNKLDINKKTKVFFTYDNNSAYIAFDVDGKKNKAHEHKLHKDDEKMLSNEWVAFSIDTYNDGLISYTFFVDIFGNQFDGTLNSAKDLSNSFSIDFESAVKHHKNGYTVEMKIPLGKLPIPKDGDLIMGILFVHNDSKNGGEYQYPFISNDTKNKIDAFTKIKLSDLTVAPTNSKSGVNIWDRLAYKKNKITDLETLEGRSKGGDASVIDYYIFKKRAIQINQGKSVIQHAVPNEISISNRFMNTIFLRTYYPNSSNFETFLERSQTTAFIVLQNDTILYERYFNGFNQDSTFTSFSMAKSVTSILIGIAIQHGYIKSVDDKITTYIPELEVKDGRFKEISVGDLLSMSSGIHYNVNGFPADDDFTYIAPDLRKTALNKISISKEPNKEWLYNNYNPILLGMILERATKKNVSEFLEEYLWSKIGTKQASWSLDETGFEKMESGFNAIPRDYMNIGMLMMNKGTLNNQSMLTQAWIYKSTQPVPKPEGYYDFLTKNNLYYQYFWWGKYRDAPLHDFFAMGNKGQYLYMIPSKKIVILRLGLEYGLFTPAPLSWPELFYQFGTNIDNR